MTMTQTAISQIYSYEEAKEKATPKQYQFVLHYLATGFNGHQAVIDAGFAPKSAKSCAWKLLDKNHIQVLIKHEIELRSARVKYTADKVLERLMEIDQLDVTDILDDLGEVKAIKQWPKAWRTLISGIEVSEITEVNSDGKSEAIGMLKKIKWPDKLKNLDLLGKHVDVQAWQMPEINVNFTEELAGRMSSARNRIIDGESEQIK